MFASVDLGGNQTSLALATGGGQMLSERSIATQSHEGPDAVLSRIAALIGEMAAETGNRVVALGMGVPGLVDVHRGRTLFLPNLPTQWREVAVAPILAARLGCPVFLLNDARMAALGELTFGQGRTIRSMVFLTIGTGIGGGVVIERRLRLGPLGAAGEIGHQTILPDGPLCGCGSRGCLETLAAAPALIGEGVRLMKSGLAPHLYEAAGGEASNVTVRLLAQAAERGDGAVREGILRAARYLGIGIANMVTTLHPDLVVLGGAASQIGHLLLDAVRREVRERVRMFPVDNMKIEFSALEDKAGLWGGFALAIARAGRAASHAVGEES